MNGNKRTMIVCKTTKEQSKMNYVYVNDNVNSEEFLVVNHGEVFNVCVDSFMEEGKIALSKAQREFANVKIGDSVNVEWIKSEVFKRVRTIKFDIEMIINTDRVVIDGCELVARIKELYCGFPFTAKQKLYIEFQVGMILQLNVVEIDVEESDICGVLFSNSRIVIVSGSTRIALRNIEMINGTFSFEELGIGGLKREFEIMFRRAFVQRMFDPELIRSLGVSHVKGIILHGPPGTGKTLIARQLGALLNAREPKVVNGPEILNKYVGQSEENIRNLFREAEEEYLLKRERSGLHIIIFDEIDAICKKRGLGGSSGIGDQVVTQLLSKIDGVKALDNVLLIGMTNRLDLIDDALLRPGRFEIHLEISLPDEESRYEIFTIHTKKMSGNNHLDSSVDLRELATLTKNYTGAEIAAVVRAAIGYALERKVQEEKGNTLNNKGNTLNNKTGNKSNSANIIGNEIYTNDTCTYNTINSNNKISNKDLAHTENTSADNTVIVRRNDFIAAVNEIKPAFGMDQKALDNFGRVFYETQITHSVITIGQSMLAKLMKTELYNTNSLLLYGSGGSRETTLSIRLGIQSGFPFI